MDNILHGLVLPQGSIPGPLLFLICINDLSDDLTSVKLFADDTSLFSIVHNMNTSTTNLNNDLNKIKSWAIQWKMNFNPDPDLCRFNHNSVKQVPSQKHLGMYLDTKLNFSEHLNNVLSKVNKTMGLLRKLQASLLRQSLVTEYKAFIRPHLDYRDIIYDQAYKESFHQKMESAQCNFALAITGVISGTSRKKLYQELGLESLRKRRWYRKLCYFFKIFKCQSPEHFFKILPSVGKTYNTRTNDKFPLFSGKHIFKKFFFKKFHIFL